MNDNEAAEILAQGVRSLERAIGTLLSSLTYLNHKQPVLAKVAIARALAEIGIPQRLILAAEVEHFRVFQGDDTDLTDPTLN